MRKGNLNDLGKFLPDNDNVKNVIDFLKDTENLQKLPVGKFEINGNEVFALIQHNELKEFDYSLWEAHKTYYDIHYVFSDTEDIAIKDISLMNNITDYNQEGDYWLFEGDLEDTITLRKGELIIFEPSDIHQPGLKNTEPGLGSSVKKVVVKVKIN